jgi:hypothetical protein
MIGIFDILFEVLPYLIWGAGPFCVFKGMGTGKDSGKLLFKKIYSDGGLSITEDSTSLDLSSTSPSQVVDLREIAFGNGSGSGLTSSTFCVKGFTNLNGQFTTDRSIFGLSIIGGTNNCNKAGISATDGNPTVQNNLRSNIIISSSGSYISLPNCRNTIVGGISNQICDCNVNSSIVSGKLNCMKCSSGSSLITSYNSCVECSIDSVIISGDNSFVYKQNQSFLFGQISNLDSNSNVTLIGNNSCVECSNVVTLIGQLSSVTASKYSTLFGCNSIISSSDTSTILNGCSNKLRGTSKSSIINGRGNCIGVSGMNIEVSGNCAYVSTIFNGYKNCLYTILDPPNYSRGGLGFKNKIIINGYYNQCGYIFNGKNNIGTVINGQKNCSQLGTIIGGKYAKNLSLYSTIFAPNMGSDDTYGSCIGGRFSVSFTIGNSISLLSPGETCNTSQGLGSNNVIIGERVPHTKILSTDITEQLGETNTECGNSNTIIQLFTNQGPSMITGNAFSLNYSMELEKQLTFNNNVIISNGSSMSSTSTGIENKGSSNIIGRQKCIENSNIIGGSNHLIMASLNSSILSGCCNYLSQVFESVIVSGSCNTIDGFKYADSKNSSARKTSCGSVILGGCENSILKGEDFTVVAGGCKISSSQIIANFLIADCVEITDKLSIYNLGTNTCTSGLSGQKNTITNLCVCNGIIVSWT